jgi:hypothetical protein
LVDGKSKTKGDCDKADNKKGWKRLCFIPRATAKHPDVTTKLVRTSQQVEKDFDVAVQSTPCKILD